MMIYSDAAEKLHAGVVANQIVLIKISTDLMVLMYTHSTKYASKVNFLKPRFRTIYYNISKQTTKAMAIDLHTCALLFIKYEKLFL